jgi:hypothetical protein
MKSEKKTYISTRLYGDTFQRMVIFTVTAMIATNITFLNVFLSLQVSSGGVSGTVHPTGMFKANCFSLMATECNSRSQVT